MRVILLILRLNISVCSQEMFGSAPINDVDVRTFGEKWRQNDVSTSQSHTDVMHESRLTPGV